MNWQCSYFPYIRKLNGDYEEQMRRIPFLNIDSLLIPSPYILDRAIDIDYEQDNVRGIPFVLDTTFLGATVGFMFD